MALQLTYTTLVANIVGDGTSTSIVAGLSEPPLNVNISGNLPIGIRVIDPSGVSASLSSGGRKAAFTFTTAPAAGAIITVSYLLFFSGE